MPAKASKSQMATVVTPVSVKESQVVKVTDVSLGGDSGWRDVSEARVQELVATFVEAGLYGVGLLRRPSVVMVAGQPKNATDGNLMLLDGKHTFHALRRVADMFAKAEAAEGDESSGPSGPIWTPLLVKAITEGVEVDYVEFKEDDDDLRAAYCAQMHDEATNRYKVTALKDLVAVATRYQKRAPGGSWDWVRDQLLAIYGSQRRTFVHRMLVAAQILPAAVLLRLDAVGLPNSYVYDNKYFVGHGADKAMRLSDSWRLAVLDTFSEEVSKGNAFSKASFEADVCKPAKVASDWLRALRREFGALADTPAVRRVEEFLMSPRAREQVLHWSRRSIRLEGTADDNGIDQCRILKKELIAAKSRGTTPASGTADDAAGSASAANAEGSADGGDSSRPAEGLLGSETVDSAHVAAMAKLDVELAKVNYYDSFAQMQGIVSRTALPGDKIVFFIDFATSKARMPLAAIEDVQRFLQGQGSAAAHKVRIFVNAGNRIDLAAAVEKQIRSVCPELPVFFMPLTSGPTQGRKRQQFLVFAADASSAKVPRAWGS